MERKVPAKCSLGCAHSSPPAAGRILLAQLRQHKVKAALHQEFACQTNSVYTLCIQEDDMKSRLAKWGNSLAVRIPKAVAEAASLREGDDLEFSVEPGGSVNLRRPKRKPSLQELVRGISAENLHASIEWGEAVGRELW